MSMGIVIMDLYKRKNTKLVLIMFMFIITIIFSTQFVCVYGDGSQQHAPQEKPSISKLISDTIATLKQPHQSPWDKVKSIVHNVQLQFFPPNLDFRSEGQGNTKGGGGGAATVEKIKEAAEKSTESAQEAAKTAGHAVGEAVHKTEEKVKKSLSINDHEEL